MGEWHLREKDLKKYPHFDPWISSKEGEALATNPLRVAKHSFYPFILYFQRWNRFADKGVKGKPKKRPICYAARSDAYILSRYRHILSQSYEAELKRLRLDGSVLAYRRISDGNGGKCNIHFTRDAVHKIQELGDCSVIALDISKYFESLDHNRLKALWCRMLGVNRLAPDHFRVFQAITKYAVVNKREVYERLGHFGVKRQSKAGRPILGFLTPFRKIPKQLCDGKEFRKKIAGVGTKKTIIKTCYKEYGIPQGAPISDLLANLYLIDFDSIVAGWVREIGGTYYRYSDDILIIVPGGEAVGRDLSARVRSLIREFGDQLIIKEEKSSIFVFERDGDDQKFRLILGTQGRNGLEYLGFRYNGRHVYLRDSTVTNLNRKIVRAARRDADACARRFPDKNAKELRSLFNFERLVKQFGKVEDFGEKQHDYRNWTFWTYAKRATDVFGPVGVPIRRQLRNYRSFVHQRVDIELDRAVVRREKRKSE